MDKPRKSRITRHDYRIGKHFLAALINDDYTGLDGEEEAAVFTEWCASVYEAHGLGTWDYDPEDYDTDFSRCEVSGLLDDCTTVYYITFEIYR